MEPNAEVRVTSHRFPFSRILSRGGTRDQCLLCWVLPRTSGGAAADKQRARLATPEAPAGVRASTNDKVSKDSM